MSIKVVLLDDEKHCTQGLSMQLKSLAPQVEVMAQFNSPILALNFVQSNSFDILFLDVEMPQLNGFDFLKKIGPPSFKVVFTTAYDQFAIKAFKFSAFDYMLKPIDDEELIQVIEKWENEQVQSPKHTEFQFDVLMDQVTNQLNKRLVLPTAEGLELLEFSDIVCIDSDSNYSKLHFVNGSSLVVSRTLKEFEELLDARGFLRIHHSHIVNIAKIRKYLKADGGYVEMSNGRKVSISRARKEQVMEVISRISM